MCIKCINYHMHGYTHRAASNNSIEQQHKQAAARVEPTYQDRYILLHISGSISGFTSFSLCFSSTLLYLLPSSTDRSGFPCEIVAIQSFCRYTNSELTTNNGSTRHVSPNVSYVLLCNSHVRTLLCFVCQRIAKAKENRGQKTSWNVHQNNIQAELSIVVNSDFTRPNRLDFENANDQDRNFRCQNYSYVNWQ